MDTNSIARPHTLPVDEVVRHLESSPQGLTSAEAARRLAAHGPNELQKTGGISPWALLLAQFKNVLIVILLVATALSAALGHGVESIAITVIVLFAVALGFVQEYRAERAIEALREVAAPTATVVRDGREVEIPSRDVVPGDWIQLRAGNRVPADVRLVEAVNLAAQEAALTGESEAVEKQSAPLDNPDLALGDRRNMAYAGTVITVGRGQAVAVATGMQTEFGGIATLLQSVETGRTPLQENLDELGRTLARIALGVVAVIVALGVARGQPFVEMLVFGIALAVAVVPEALPAVVTISLAIGVQRLVRRRALMRRLPAVEALGGTSVICSDKTGTLTRDQMTVRRLNVASRWIDVTGAGYEPRGEFRADGAPLDTGASASTAADGIGTLVRRLLAAAALASDAALLRTDNGAGWTIKGDPTEGALIVAAAKAGMAKDQLEADAPRRHEIPFSSESKRMTTLHGHGDGLVAYTKGAPEIVVDSCTRWLTTDGIAAMDDAARARILAAAHEMAGQAMRVLAVAERPGATVGDAERDMTLLGLIGMIDPPRPEAREAIRTCADAGVRVVMITGDHPATAEAVARELGLLDGGRVLTGAELDALADDALARDVEDVRVYARVSPAHKLRIVDALQRKGYVVAMTGDGVNDAPALKKADVGVAMGITGTDVAKEAAAMTLTDDNFATIVAAVEEGRGIFGNIKKYLMFLLSSNIGEIGLMAGATLLGLPLPLTAVQILYVNLATDGLPALALAVDPPEPDVMRRPPRDPRRGIFTRPVVTMIAAGGVWSTIANLGLFAGLLAAGRPVEQAMTLTFVSLVLIQFVKSYNFRSDRVSLLHRPFANRWLNLAIGWELLLLLAIVYLPALQTPLGTYAMTTADWALVGGVALTIAPVLELVKGLLVRRT